MANSTFAFWNFLEFFSKCSWTILGWICECRTWSYGKVYGIQLFCIYKTEIIINVNIHSIFLKIYWNYYCGKLLVRPLSPSPGHQLNNGPSRAKRIWAEVVVGPWTILYGSHLRTVTLGSLGQVLLNGATMPHHTHNPTWKKWLQTAPAHSQTQTQFGLSASFMQVFKWKEYFLPGTSLDCSGFWGIEEGPGWLTESGCIC